MSIQKGQIVYSGQSAGKVLQRVGVHAVKVWTAFEKTEQDFLTSKLTVVKGFRSEVWPLRSIQLTPSTPSTL